MNISPAPATNNQALTIKSAGVTHTLRKINPRRAAGPDVILGRVLRENEAPGEASPATHQGCSATHPGPSPIANRSADNTTSTVLHTVLHHLEQQGAYAPLLFMDYSSTFNTIPPCTLFSKMSHVGVQHNLCLCIKDYLTDRPQSVRMGRHLSSILTLSTGRSRLSTHH